MAGSRRPRCIRSRQNVGNGVVPLAALSGSRCDRDGSAQLPEPKREAKVCTGNTKSPHAGAGRQPPDREVQRAAVTMRLPRRPLKRSPGRVMPPPVAEYGTRVPSLYRADTSRSASAEETAREQVDGRRELAPRGQSAASALRALELRKQWTWWRCR